MSKKRSALEGADPVGGQEAVTTDDVPFEIEDIVVEEPSEVLPEESEDAYAEETVDDDIPVAVVKDDDRRERRSTWRMLSSEDFPQLSLREILGGDYLIGSFLRRNILFILVLVGLAILYISNRYAAQQEIIEHEELRKELTEKKNYALTQYAELTMNSRQSSIENRLKSFGDSLLTAPKEPPFIIRVKE